MPTTDTIEQQVLDMRRWSRLLYRAWGGLRNDRESRLPMAEGHALMMLRERGEMSPSELAVALGIQRSPTSQILKRLLAKGYCCEAGNSGDQGDRRRRKYAPSELGLTVLRDLDAHVDSEVAEAIGAIPADERRSFIDQLGIYTEQLRRIKSRKHNGQAK